VGYAGDGRRLLLTHAPAPAAPGGHQVRRYLDLVRMLGGDGVETPRLRVADDAIGAAERLLSAHGMEPGEPAVALNPGSVYGGAKRWPAERYAAVADALADRGYRILLVGSGGEAPVLGAVAAAMRRSPVTLAGRTDLPTLAAVLRRSRLLLTNDTGAMHLAGAVGVPVLALFGPTDAQATGPLGTTARIVREAVPCSPCLYRECPIDHRCMTRISVAQVLEAALALLDHPPSPEPATPDSRPAAFLDRDGTIIEDLGYLGDPAQIRLIPGAVEALRDLQRAGYRLVLITNQAGVARGLITERDVERVNQGLTQQLAASGIRFDAVFYCPHHPEHGPPEYRVNCECRKPGPGMVRRAVAELKLDPSRSVIIGDHSTDARVARAFPGMRGVLVRTGHGAAQAEQVARGELEAPDHVAADLAAAVQWVLAAKDRDVVPSHPS
jgi:heptosyltransferase-2